MSWSWPLFAWGIGVGVVGVAGSYVLGRVAGLNYDQRRAYLGLLLLSLVVAVTAAAIPSATVDVGFTIFVMVANFVLPLALLPRISRQAAPHACGSGESCGAEACATCPLAATSTAVQQ